MALFSRRKKSDAVAPPKPDVVAPQAPDAPQSPDHIAEADAPGAAGFAHGESVRAEPVATPDAEAAPSVGISVSSYQGLGSAPTNTPTAGSGTPASGTPAPAARPTPRPSPGPRPVAREEAPAPTESVPGIRDNVLLAEALEALGAIPEPTSVDLMNVTRQFMQGHVFLRVRGDARSLLSEGKDLPLAVIRNGDNQFLVAYSTGAALQASARADQDPGTSAIGQPVGTVIRHMLAGPYAGIILDQSSPPARAVIPRELLERVVKEGGDESFTLKNLLSQPRTPETPALIGAALARAPLWVAVGQVPGEGPDEKPRVGVAESRTPEGLRYLEVFSHPLEVHALGRGNQAMPFPAEKLAVSLRDHRELTGVVVDPGGPWIRLDREALAPVLALAETD